jgi:hypothetical protein
MKVRATMLGYYGHERRYPGDVFTLEPIKRMRKDKEGKLREVTIRAEQQFSERWMEKVEETVPAKRKSRPNNRISSPTTLAQRQEEAEHQEAAEETTEGI